MASVNRVILIGNIGKDPDIRHMPNGDAVANIGLATTESWKDKSGEKQEKTEWHKVAFFGKLAEIVGEYCKKGSAIYIEGRIQTRKWQDKEGQDRYTTEIIADRMQMLGGKTQESGVTDEQMRNRKAAREVNKPSDPGSFEDFQDDIPF